MHQEAWRSNKPAVICFVIIFIYTHRREEEKRREETMEAMQYEQARNMTLLFFFERLLDKGEPRTLHDLSCQFGSKGFTKEMRQIAGGSQSGLKKFLAQYPSLFAIEGDYVNVSDVDLDNNKESSGNYPINSII